MGNGIIKFLKESLLSVVYSEKEDCVLCSADNFFEELICKDCYKKIEFYNKSFSIKHECKEIECYSATYYSGAILELVRRLKYKSDFASGEAMVELLIRLLKNNVIDYDLITYVPMTRSALTKRGFNQGKFLAVSLANAVHKPAKKLIKKIKSTKDQIGLDASNRWENVSKCFKSIDKDLIKNKKILLVDDVVTTGATAFCCCMELLKCGADKVTVLTVAKSKL